MEDKLNDLRVYTKEDLDRAKERSWEIGYLVGVGVGVAGIIIVIVLLSK